MSVLLPASMKLPFKFSSDIHNELTGDFQKIKINDTFIDEAEVQIKLDTLYKWICITPTNITYRVNTLKTTVEEVVRYISNAMMQYARCMPSISLPTYLPEVIIVHCWDNSVNLDLIKYKNEIIVDAACGSAVLRGSHIFAPGVIGIPRGLSIGDTVSVFADIAGRCKKGSIKPYDDENKVFLGNGIIKQTRSTLFDNNKEIPSGIAVYMTAVVSRLSQLNNYSIPEGWALLQNLPSIICSRVLNPQPNEIILDMCAAPGNKTTHISTLMNGKGIVIALEKNKSKLLQIKTNCDKFSSGNVKIFYCDSTKALSDIGTNESIIDGPPFNENSFDRVLLDSPCSALGQRPQLLNTITIKQLRSYVPLQRKLFSVAVRLLKQNGILVYSTCTITIAENEGIVSWALKTYPCLELKSVKDQLELQTYGSGGYSIDGLPDEQSCKVCRFGSESDTVGFFIACFIKKGNRVQKSEITSNLRK